MPHDHVLSIGLSVALGAAVLAAGTCMGQAAERPAPRPLVLEAGCHRAGVIDAEGSGITGRAKLCATEDGHSFALEAEGLMVGHAYTAWLAYFDRPIECQWRPCGFGDALGEEPVGVLARMDGRVADRSTEIFWGDFHGLRLSRGSQATLYLLGRGVILSDDNRHRARQLLALRAVRIDDPAPDAASDNPVRAFAARAVFDIR
jgi:hypothetical protein